MSGPGTTLIFRRDAGSGLVVGFPGAPGDPTFWDNARAAYTAEGNAVNVEAHGAFLADAAAVLDALTGAAPITATGVLFPQATVAPLPSFFASPTQCPILGRGSDAAGLRAMVTDARTSADEERKAQAEYALAMAGVMRRMDGDRRVAAPERTGGLVQVIAVAGVIVGVAAVDLYFSHLERVAQIESDRAERLARERIAAAARAYTERLRQRAITGTMPPPSEVETAVREERQQRARTEWDELARTVAQGAGGLATAGMWAVGLWLAWKVFGKE